MKIKGEILFFIVVLSTLNLFSQKLKVGSKMPSFELMDQYGEYFNSNDYLNKQSLVVFFYTKDKSPICTREVLEFNKSIEKFKNQNAVVVGINSGSFVTHREFVVKYQLKYPILYDRNGEVQKAFNVPNIKRTKNPQRYTFVVNKKGFIQKIFHMDDNAEIHIIESLKILDTN